MRIGLVSFHSFLNPGGVKRHIFGLHKEFKKRGIYSKIIIPRRKKSEYYGKDVIFLGTSFPVRLSGTQGDIDVNFNPLAIEKVLQKEQFDILHLHNLGPTSSIQILERSRSLNILTIHTNPEGSKFLKISGLLYLWKKIIQWKIDGVIGVAPFILDIVRDFKGPKTVIPNGIDLKQFNPNVSKIKKFAGDDKINILFVGRIEERKGLIYLLKAFRILQKKGQSNIRLIIVGEGPLKNDCQKYVYDNELKEVYFEKKASEKQISSYYRSCDIFCSPAIFGESFGLVLLEAMACGKPVVAFANRGYKYFLKDKKDASFLVRPRNYISLAKKLEILIKDKKLRKKMGENAFKRSKEYSWEKIASQVLDFYNICQEQKKNNKRRFFLLDKIVNKFYQTTNDLF